MVSDHGARHSELCKWSRNQPILDLMMAWVEDNIDSLNIKMVIGVGDLVENNEKITTDYDGNQTTQQQWQSAARAFGKLDGKVPYIAATGNHDYSIDRQGNRSSRYHEFFHPEKFSKPEIFGTEQPERKGPTHFREFSL
ncbi:metallophosphoesterase [Niabella sp. W65]|nr:metallophosphoesterase [Niabella sp. W65]MCH7365266.1 metallophosphoesterase [Niabella sp. W65]